MDVFKQLSGGLSFKSGQNKATINYFKAPEPDKVPAQLAPSLNVFDNDKTIKSKAGLDRSATKQGRPANDSQGSTSRVQQQKVKVDGEQVNVLPEWEALPLPTYLARNLSSLGWTQPTPVQSQVAPAMVAGQEVLVAAPTGSGKTAAYCLPILIGLKKSKPQAGVRAMIVVPTRELAVQVETTLKDLTKSKPFKIIKLAAGSKLNENGALNYDIVIATPQRLAQVLANPVHARSLSSVTHLVLDESDKLLHDEFLSQVDNILATTANEKRLIHMFSATMLPGVETLAKSVMKAPVLIDVGARNAAVSSVQQSLVYCGSERGKLVALRQLIRNGVSPPVLIFVQSRERADELHRELLIDGLSVDALTGAKSAAERDRITLRFRQVINYDLPQTAVDYIHRVGRTGRMGRDGVAVTYYSDDDIPNLRPIINVIKQAGQDIPEHLKHIKKLKTALMSSKRERVELEKRPTARSRVGTDSLEAAKELETLRKAQKRFKADEVTENSDSKKRAAPGKSTKRPRAESIGKEKRPGAKKMRLSTTESKKSAAGNAERKSKRLSKKDLEE